MTLRQDRLARGLCPNCGKEAAPYFLCGDCRFKAKIVRVLNRGGKVGGFKKERRGRAVYWSIGNEAALDTLVWRPDPKEGDRRSRPRLGRVPVLVENELVKLIESMDRPATLEEIMEAWARLREKRRTSSAAGDMAKIIEAKRRRERRQQKRLAQAA
jgi:hypothetical protein